MGLLRRAVDTAVLDLFAESGRNVERASALLRRVLADHPEHAGLARELKEVERRGDRLAHDAIHRLRARDGERPPVDVGDGHALATSLDDIVDYAEQAADLLGLHGVEGPMDQAIEIAEVLVEASRHVAAALQALREGAGLGEHLAAIDRLEEQGDRLHRDAVKALFASGVDPMVVIRWKDIFGSLEDAVDACEKVAHVLEGIDVKRRR